MFNRLFYLTIMSALNVVAKRFTGNSCGSEVYSIYHTQLNVPCYEDHDIDDLPIMDLKKLQNDSIFFIEASCKGGLNIRQACSVEAAARNNPSRRVYVFFAGIVSHQCIRSQPLTSLLSYENVRLYRIHPENFALDTGLEHLLKSKVVNEKPYPIMYVLDLLKFITLYKFGGVYMDLDMLSTRPFDELPFGDNWFSIADHRRGVLSAGIMSVSNNDIGRILADSFVSALKMSRTEEVSSSEVVKEGVQSVCGAVPFENSRRGISFTCHGVVLYASEFFMPVPCEASGGYFYSNKDIIFNLTRSYTQQLCNGFTYDKDITKKSIYANLMNLYCPKVYNYFDIVGFKEQRETVEDLADMGADYDNVLQKEQTLEVNGVNIPNITQAAKNVTIVKDFSIIATEATKNMTLTDNNVLRKETKYNKQYISKNITLKETTAPYTTNFEPAAENNTKSTTRLVNNVSTITTDGMISEVFEIDNNLTTPNHIISTTEATKKTPKKWIYFISKNNLKKNSSCHEMR